MNLAINTGIPIYNRDRAVAHIESMTLADTRAPFWTGPNGCGVSLQSREEDRFKQSLARIVSEISWQVNHG